MTKPEQLTSTHERLHRAAQMIQTLDGRRQALRADRLGSNIERMIINRELDDLESEILQNPGALAPHLERTPPH
ncbi:MAG: hypothetical protein GY953_55350 [bacterium]|nr:hypothetical protein [bacterium]